MEQLGKIEWIIPIRPAASAVTLSLRHATSEAMGMEKSERIPTPLHFDRPYRISVHVNFVGPTVTIRRDYWLTCTGTSSVVHREFPRDLTTSSAVNFPMTIARLRLSVVWTGVRSIRVTYSIARVPPRFTCTTNFVVFIVSLFNVQFLLRSESLRV